MNLRSRLKRSRDQIPRRDGKMEILMNIFSVLVMVVVIAFAWTIFRDIWGSGPSPTGRKR